MLCARRAQRDARREDHTAPRSPEADTLLVDTRPDTLRAADTCPVDKRLVDNHPAADTRIAEADIDRGQAVQLAAAGLGRARVAQQRVPVGWVQLLAAMRPVQLHPAPPTAAPTPGRYVPVPPKAASWRVQVELRVQLSAALRRAPARRQSLRSVRCKRNMSRY